MPRAEPRRIEPERKQGKACLCQGGMMDTHRVPEHVSRCPHSLLEQQTARLGLRWKILVARSRDRATGRQNKIVLALHRQRRALEPVDLRRELEFSDHVA